MLKPVELLSRSQQYRRKRLGIVNDGRGFHGHTVRGEDHYRWNRDQLLSSHGYIKVRVSADHHLADPNGYAYEHDLVAEQMIGRELAVDEVVHHKNKVKTDNRPENLAVMKKDEHARQHMYERLGGPRPGTGEELDGRVWHEFPEVAG